MKVCKKCGEEKSLDEFYRHSQMKDGYLNVCKVCKREYQKNRPAEAKAAIERRRNQKPDRKRKLYGRVCQWRKENPVKAREQANRYPERRKARTAVGNAVRDGILKKEPCADCGAVKVHAHHDDYSKPLDVTWLCAKHHKERHDEK